MSVCFLTERMLLGYGVDLVVDRLAQGLSRKGFEVSVCCNIHDDTFLGKNYDIYRIPYKRNLLNPRRTERNAERALNTFIDNQDVLIACTFPYFHVASISGKPWVAIDFGVVPPTFFTRRIKRELEYHWKSHYLDCFPNASEIICISNFLRQNIPNEIRKRAEVVHLGIDHYPRRFLGNIKKIFNIKELLLLYVGRSSDISPYKNTDSLLRVFRNIKRAEPNIELMISTSCSHEEQGRLERQGAIVVNAVAMDFMPSLYNSSDLFVTATQWEGFDLPLLEASYFGLPVLANKIGAHPEIVQHGRTGYLAANDEEFTEYLLKLLRDHKLRTELGLNGRLFAETNFPWSKTVDRYASILHDLQ